MCELCRLWLTSNNTAVEVVMGGGASAEESMSVLNETGGGGPWENVGLISFTFLLIQHVRQIFCD